MAVILEEPERIGRIPVVAIAVEDNGGVVADTDAGNEAFELAFVDEIATHLILEFGVPIEFDCPGNVADFVEKNVFVGFNDTDLGVGKVIGNPVG